MAFTLQTSAFADGAVIPLRYTCDGPDSSPELSWSGQPGGTQSFVLIVDDPDAPVGVWNHWLLYDIPARVNSLPEGWKPGKIGVSGRNDFGSRGYGGPCPPHGHGTHRYSFRLYALDVKSLGLPEGARRVAIENGMEGHILAEARYMGTCERR